MIKFNYTNQEGKKLEVTAPNSYYELPLDMFIRIEKEGKQDVMKLFSILSGVNLKVAENCTDKKLERAVWEVVAFLSKPFDFAALDKPEKIEIDGQIYDVPKKLESLMIGQKIMIAQIVKSVEDMVNQMPKIMAVLMMPAYNKGEFDSDKIDELAGKLLNSNALSCYAITKGFFLTSNHLKNYGVNGLKEYQKSKTKTKKLHHKWLSQKDSINLKESV